MKLKVDEKADALYLRIDESRIVESEEVSPGIVIDYNEQNAVVGVEILNLSKRSSNLNLRSLQYETVWKLLGISSNGYWEISYSIIVQNYLPWNLPSINKYNSPIIRFIQYLYFWKHFITGTSIIYIKRMSILIKKYLHLTYR